MRELYRNSGRAGEESMLDSDSQREEECQRGGEGGRVRDKEERWERGLER